MGSTVRAHLNRPEKVIVSQHGEYSIWPARRDPPPHWKEAGFAGTRAACIAWVAAALVERGPAAERPNLPALLRGYL